MDGWFYQTSKVKSGNCQILSTTKTLSWCDYQVFRPLPDFRFPKLGNESPISGGRFCQSLPIPLLLLLLPDFYSKNKLIIKNKYWW